MEEIVDLLGLDVGTRAETPGATMIADGDLTGGDEMRKKSG